MAPPKRAADGQLKLSHFFAVKPAAAAVRPVDVPTGECAPAPTVTGAPPPPPPAAPEATVNLDVSMAASPPPEEPAVKAASSTPPPPPPSLPTASSPAAENEYEAARDARVRANAAMMASLGLADAAAKLAGAVAAAQPKRRAPRAPRAKAPAVPDGERRRSLRSRGGGGGSGGGEGGGAPPAPRSPTPPPIDFDDDTVLRYVLEEGKQGAASASTTATIDRVASFRRAPLSLTAPTLARAYSVASRGPLLAAGGKDGVVAVWGVAGGWAAQDGDDDGDRPPLAAAKLHRSWVADVALVPAADAAVPLLLTASNDGAVAAWDLAACAGGGGGRAARAGPPREAGRADGLHDGSGLFSLHAAVDGGAVRIATAAKDGSVRLSTLRGDAAALLTPVATIDDAHAGVAKCVRWRSDAGGPPIAASCGNDGAARVFDARTPSAAVAAIDAAVGTLHVLRWRPGSDHTLLLAGGGPDTPLYDLRAATSPAATLRGPPGAARGSAIYQPAFVGASGDAVAVGLPRAGVLSVHDAATGAPRSRGDAGHDCATLAPGPGGALLAVGTRRLHVFSAVGVE